MYNFISDVPATCFICEKPSSGNSLNYAKLGHLSRADSVMVESIIITADLCC
jgi:hypothetical protein